jgi:hypothetical protein
MSEQEIDDLVLLDPSHFDDREHTALTWVRSTLTVEDGAAPEEIERFERAFTSSERKYVIASMKGMYFVNLLNNTLERWARKTLKMPALESKATCKLD